MSIIVAVRSNGRTVMAADTLTCFGETRMPAANARTAKIQRLGRSIVGSSGWAVYDCILRDYLHEVPTPELGDEREIFLFFLDLWKAMHDRYTMVNDQAQSKDSPFGDLDASFLIANAGGIFKVCNDLDVSRLERYGAIGSGADFALGAMQVLYDVENDPETIARRAVEVSSQFDVYCGGETDVMDVG